ncbi:inhibin beta B chain [Microcaecilia unicolor]|uniref:Inhibin beta B chain-like n=1 Tax=Microcaecilia unicolor TaxID=1415580 RepID=A0A6P7XF22_9AMPH|nr:inhibin beta B chain-like [Microcaecilia unicolor]
MALTLHPQAAAASYWHEWAWFYLLALVTTWAASSMAEERNAGCPSCGVPSVSLEPGTERQIMLELAKQQILQKLQLTERPNITHPIPRLAVVNALRRLHPAKARLEGLRAAFNWDSQGENPNSEQQSFEIISFAESEYSSDSKAKLNFQFTREKSQNLKFVHAHLWLYFKSQKPKKTNLTLRLFLTEEDTSRRTFISEKELEVKWSGWRTFSLMPALQSFFNRAEKSLRLELDCKGCQDALAVVNASESHQPFLVAQAKVREPSHHVTKRSLSCDQNTKLCCRKDYYVNFKDIGWTDWIIMPEGYQINYCIGTCPMHIAGAPGMAASFHSAVLSLIKANNIHTGISSCCVPTERRPLSMLYFDKDNNIVKTDIPNMIVEACGCT